MVAWRRAAGGGRRAAGGGRRAEKNSVPKRAVRPPGYRSSSQLRVVHADERRLAPSATPERFEVGSARAIWS